MIHLLNRCTRLTRLELWKTQRIGVRTLQAIVGRLRTTPRTTALKELIVRDLPVLKYATAETMALHAELDELLDKFVCTPAPMPGPPADGPLPAVQQNRVNYNETGEEVFLGLDGYESYGSAASGYSGYNSDY